ncbi:hypothetical protein LCGC14_2276720, partial [marine sediment metagenome]
IEKVVQPIFFHVAVEGIIPGEVEIHTA